MCLPRFSIAGLMGLVVVVAVGAAALRFASELWASVLLMLTLGVLGAAVLACHERTEKNRAWWRGFALFGWGYVLLAMGPWASEAISPHLPTTMGLDALYAKMHPAPDAGSIYSIVGLGSGDWVTHLDSSGTTVISLGTLPRNVTPRAWLGNSTPESFRRVGHCLWALLVAGVGGIIGRAFDATGRQTRLSLDGPPLPTP
jgi:hypothetical protein